MIGQVSDIDVRLYSHLFQCQMTHRAFERALGSFEEVDKVFRVGQKVRAESLRSGEPLTQAFREEHAHLEAMIQFHATRAVRAWNYCTEHAELATYFLDRLVFNRWPRPLARLRMRWRPNDIDRRFANLLRTGEMPKGEGTE